MIDRNPVSKVSRPKPRKNPSEIPSNDTNLELLDYVINGELDGRKSVFREYTKERDIAIILLIMGVGIKGSDVVNNVFHQSGNYKLTSVATGDSDEYVLQRYKAYLEQYECRKGRDFSVDIF